MTNERDRVRFLPSILAAAAVLAASGVSGPCAVGADVTPAEKEAYRAAMAESSKPSQAMVSNRLLALVPGDDPVNAELLKGARIRWSGDGTKVLVGSLLARSDWEKYYAPCLGKESCPLQKSLWVSVVPELKTRFAPWERWGAGWVRTVGEECPPAQRRVVQILGLNPAKAYDVLVEMWVDPKDLFRPAGDPETRGHGGEAAEQRDGGTWVFPSDRSIFTKLDDSVMYKDAAWSTPSTGVPYRQWYAANAASTYSTSDPDMSKWGSPWTQLGYTYDWGSSSRFGISEFILRIDPCRGAPDPAKPCDGGGLLLVKVEQGVDLGSDAARAGYFSCDPTW
jgi:hypothetical protein